MPVYYAMRYLSGVLCNVTTIKEHPHAKTPNAAPQPPPEAQAERSGAEAGGGRLQAVVRPGLTRGKGPSASTAAGLQLVPRCSAPRASLWPSQ
jgi:hypothetical protein